MTICGYQEGKFCFIGAYTSARHMAGGELDNGICAMTLAKEKIGLRRFQGQLFHSAR